MGIVLRIRERGRAAPAVAAGWALGAFVAVLVLLGCLPEDLCTLPLMEQTPRGYWVNLPDGQSLAGGFLQKEAVLAWLDTRVDEWVARREMDYGGREHLYEVAREYPFLLYDDYRFACESSPTGYCAGQHWYLDDHCKRIEAAIWSRAVSSAPPLGGPDFLTRYENGTYSYAYLPGGTGLWVIGHELDHAIGINHP